MIVQRVRPTLGREGPDAFGECAGSPAQPARRNCKNCTCACGQVRWARSWTSSRWE